MVDSHAEIWGTPRSSLALIVSVDLYMNAVHAPSSELAPECSSKQFVVESDFNLLATWTSRPP